MRALRFNGQDPLQYLRQMDDFFRGLGANSLGANGPEAAPRGGQFPLVNVMESAEGYSVEAELPGIQMENLEVVVKNNELLIRGERLPSREANVTYHRRERGLGKFERRVRLPVDVDSEQVSATLRDGVLVITLPKAAEARPKKITVKAV